MSDQSIPDVEEVLAISDPGEVDRHTHGFADRLMINVGNVVSWMFPILMIAIVSQVFLRGAGNNQAWLDDAQWWMYGFAMLTAFGYAITTNSHVRVDILHQNYSDAKKARIEVFAIGWLLLPFIALMTDVLVHYSWQSIISGEGSSSPNGLHRVYLLKATLPVLFLLAAAAGWARFKHNLKTFTDTGLATQLLWMLPTAIFVGWRLVHYAAYWVIYFTNAEIRPRRITREPFFDHTLWVSVALVVALIAVGLLRRRRGDN
ncbi:TRAP transporter small permease subunit [uncultured Litoreibacter sp.]|uniref:TRAP transporter small permease subunit n=1 Tax=uncultured Litoreibacter sp. TaxID=1392394 RepID=UPI0026219826|nr:TRAP transporter small permease subunit [uncultured Litoreibacter sp.]